MMWQAIKHWWNQDEIRVQEVLNRLDALSAKYEAEQAEKAKLIAENEELKAKLNPDYDKSTIPHFVLSCNSLDEVRGLQIELDWNPALIQHLRDAGHTGRDDEILIQKWLAMLYEELIDKLEQTLINNSDKPRESEYQ